MTEHTGHAVVGVVEQQSSWQAAAPQQHVPTSMLSPDVCYPPPMRASGLASLRKTPQLTDLAPTITCTPDITLRSLCRPLSVGNTKNRLTSQLMPACESQRGTRKRPVRDQRVTPLTSVGPAPNSEWLVLLRMVIHFGIVAATKQLRSAHKCANFSKVNYRPASAIRARQYAAQGANGEPLEAPMTIAVEDEPSKPPKISAVRHGKNKAHVPAQAPEGKVRPGRNTFAQAPEFCLVGNFAECNKGVGKLASESISWPGSASKTSALDEDRCHRQSWARQVLGSRAGKAELGSAGTGPSQPAP